MAAEAMFASLVKSPVVSETEKLPVLLVMMMENRTRDPIDMENLTNKISTALIRAGQSAYS
ncbi:MAG: hypothetical protein U5N86_00310 [Planctomycetota bacterium]|nr:hypothetical protein [Planctomycetota bacterium]